MVLFTVLKISDTNIYWRCICFVNLTSSQGLFSVHNEKALINIKKKFFIGFNLFIKIKLFAVSLKRQTIKNSNLGSSLAVCNITISIWARVKIDKLILQLPFPYVSGYQEKRNTCMSLFPVG